MIKVCIQPLAKKDLKGIWHYSLTNWGENQTIKYYYKITDTIKSLANNPYIGVACDYIK